MMREMKIMGLKAGDKALVRTRGNNWVPSHVIRFLHLSDWASHGGSNWSDHGRTVAEIIYDGDPYSEGTVVELSDLRPWDVVSALAGIA